MKEIHRCEADGRCNTGASSRSIADARIGECAMPPPFWYLERIELTTLSLRRVQTEVKLTQSRTELAGPLFCGLEVSLDGAQRLSRVPGRAPDNCCGPRTTRSQAWWSCRSMCAGRANTAQAARTRSS